MKELFEELILSRFNLEPKAAMFVYLGLVALITVLLAFIANIIAKKVLLTYMHKIAKKTSNKIDDILIEKKVFQYLAHVAPGIVVYYMARYFTNFASTLEKLAIAYIIITVTIAIFRSLDAVVAITRSKSLSKSGPVKGIVQVVKIVVVVFNVLLIVVNFMGNSTAWAIFSGIGGMSAVLLLVFKDSILGLVAGMQLSSGGLLKVGDWLEMSKYHANGEVVDIALTKITVRNWDKTYTTVPAYKFLEDSFKNWEGMAEAGGRRIKRSISIDLNSVRFLSEEEIMKLREINVLKPYFSNRLEEIAQFNLGAENENNANIRRLTNIGTFRTYIYMYLKAHPNIHDSFTLLVRQLPPTGKGLPIELYCFTKDPTWRIYEDIQADIFDHLIAIIPEFGLRIFQEPTGADFMRL